MSKDDIKFIHYSDMAKFINFFVSGTFLDFNSRNLISESVIM